MTKLRYTMLIVTVFLVLALSAINTFPALADDSTPPPTETPIAETPPTEEVTPPVEESTPVAETVTDLLASVPEGTDVVVVNEEGETVPLVTQEAVDAIEFIDPVWCPAGIAPKTDGSGGCTTSYGNLKLLVDDLMAGTAGVVPGANGVIWIQANADSSSGAILLDGSDTSLGNMENFSLTLQGGWNGVHGSTTVSLQTPSTFTQSLSIINWNGAITLNNITFSGVTVGSASNNAVLNIQTTKNVTLTNVNTSNNTGAGVKGVYIDNDEGTVVSSVTVNTSNINSNNNAGLTVYSDGVITLKDVTANNNGNIGIYLNNTAGTAVVGVNLTGATIAAANGDHGIQVFSDGAITASNLVANGNSGTGVHLENASALTALGVTISGSSNQFKFNGYGGMYIHTNGAITLNSISVNNNQGAQGAWLENNGFTNGSAKVTLTGTNSFKENAYDGLVIYSDGIVTLNNVTANENGIVAANGHGVYVGNFGASSPKAVTITGVNVFNANYFSGLYVASDGAISISNASASSNLGGDGIYFQNNSNPSAPQNVTLTGMTNVNDNGNSGLTIRTYGIVTVGNINANFNDLFGVDIDNSSGTLAKVVNMAGTINNFENNGDTGLRIFSLGAITLNNVQAISNGYVGVFLDNTSGTPAVGVTINGTSNFNDNQFNGLNIQTKGNIVVKDFYAQDNNYLEGSNGLLLDNYQSGTGTGNVTLGTTRVNWINYVSTNYDSGIQIRTNGTVVLYNIASSGNGNNAGVSPFGYGLDIDNSTASTPKSVTLNGANYFDFNYDGGLRILTDGAVILNNIRSTNNGGAGDHGVLIDNDSVATVPQNVSILGINNFSVNGEDGLHINTFGTVTLANITANDNGGTGVFVDNFTGATMVRGVTQTGYLSSEWNGDDGVNIHTLGAISLNNLTASHTLNGNGAILDNDETGAVGGITIAGFAQTSFHLGTGLHATSRGSITITNLSASSSNYGAILDNSQYASSVGTITLLGTDNSAFSNTNSGLTLTSNRAITVANLNTGSNGGHGVFINNTTSGTALPQNVTISGTNSFDTNGLNGLFVVTYGTITANNLTANNNGVYFDNCTLSIGDCTTITAKNVIITGTNTFNDNSGTGLLVESKGAITINAITAIGNTFNGAYLSNQRTTTTSNGITLTGINTFDDNGTGLQAYSNGAVTLNSVNASLNTGNGVFINASNSTLSVAHVKLTGTNVFNDNGNEGLRIEAGNTISLNNITANGNGLEGAWVSNTYTGLWGGATIKITGVNTFSDNDHSGLFFSSLGLVDITNITADNNDATNLNNGSGVLGASAVGAITISCGSMTNNGNYGWSLGTAAASTVTLKGVFATLNGTDENETGGIFVKTRTCP